jgi:hypothetical protein
VHHSHARREAKRGAQREAAFNGRDKKSRTKSLSEFDPALVWLNPTFSSWTTVPS